MADDKVGLHKGYEHWVSPAPLNEDWDKDLEFVLIRTLDDLRVHDVEHKFVAWDTETSGLNPEMDWIVGFSFSFDGKTGYYVPVKHDDIALGKEALDIFYSILKKAGTQLLYNCRFDQRFMEYAGYNLEGLPYYDAMNAIWLADTNMVLPSLKASERHYLGWTPKTFSETLGDATTFQHVPAEDAYKYACTDAIGTYKIAMISNRYYVENKPASKYDNDMLYPLMRLENTPQRLDTEYLLSLRPQVDETIGRTKAEVYRLAGQEFNLNSPQQFGKILVERFAVDTGARTATGAMKADLKTVDAWLTKHSATVAQDVKDFLKAYKEYKKTVKFKSAYLEKYIKAAQEQDKFPVRFSYKVQSVPCLTDRNTVLVKDRGLCSIGDVKADDLIWTAWGYKRVLWNNSHIVDGVYRVCLENGMYIEGTGHHPVLVRTSPLDKVDPRGMTTNDVEWAGIADLKVGEPVITNHTSSALLCEDKNRCSLARVLGYFFGNGYITDSNSMCLFFDDIQMSVFYRDLLYFVFGGMNVSYKDIDIHHVEYYVSKKNVQKAAHEGSCVKDIALGMARSPETFRHFLVGYLDSLQCENHGTGVKGDMSCHVAGNEVTLNIPKHDGDIVVPILWACAIPCDVSVTDKTLHIMVCEPYALSNLLSLWDSYDAGLAWFKSISIPESFRLYSESCVKSVEYIEEPLVVYDIEVEDVHEYVANGIVTHNTGRLSCLSRDALVHTRQGLVPIVDITEEHDIEVSPNKFAKAKLVHTGEQDFVKIVMLSGKEIECTTDHRFLCPSDEGFVWRYARDLKVSDMLCRTPVTFTGCDINFEMFVYGFFLVDGSYYSKESKNKYSLRMFFCEKDHDAMMYIHDGLVVRGIPHSMRPCKDSLWVIEFAKEGSRRLSEMFPVENVKQSERRVDFSYIHSKVDAFSVLAGVYQAEGEKYIRPYDGKMNSSLNVTSYALVQSLQRLADYVGIRTKIHAIKIDQVKHPTHNKQWRLQFCVKSFRKYLDNSISFRINTKKDVPKFLTDSLNNLPKDVWKVGEMAKFKAMYHNKRYSLYSVMRLCEDSELPIEVFDYEQVVSIEPCGKKEAYTLAVDDPLHRYIAEGFIHHNCGADAKNSFFTKNNVQCLEENTEVLTSEGIKPIKDIVTGELVWSGSAFVPCVQLGSKQKRCETIWTYFGKITASLEHKFYTLNLLTFELEWECLGNAISCGKPLVRNTNDGGFTFRELLENEMFKKSVLLKPELSEERIKELEETYEDVRFDMIRKADNFWYPNIIPPEVTVYDLCVPTYERFTANGFIVHNSTPKPHAIMLKGRKATEQEIAEKKDILGWYFSNDIPDEEAKGLVEGMEPGNLNIRRAFLPENDQCYVVSIDMCLEGGSPVQTKRGYMGICELKPGDEVWSPQGWVPVSRVMRTGVEKVIKVLPDNGGQAIYCTENHPFVINGEKVKARDIKGKVPSTDAHDYSSDMNVFDGDSTPTSAYLLGFVLCSGNVLRYVKDENTSLLLVVWSEDEQHLRSIGKILGGSYEVRHKVTEQSEWWVLHLSRNDVCERLISLGIPCGLTTSSGRVNFEWLSENFRHFVRGMFDAIGSVKTDEEFTLELAGDSSYMIDVQKRLDGQWKYIQKSRTYLMLQGTVEQRKFIYEYLYQEATIWLQRKRDIIESWYQDKFGDLVFPVWNCTVDTTEHQLYVQCTNVHQCAEELRIVANLCHEDTWINAFNSGADVHKACYSPDTEFMTERGWLTADKITPDMKIAYYDDNTDSVKFTRADKRCTNDATEVYSREDTFDVTDNHRMYVKCANEESYGIVLAKDLKSKGNPRQRFTMKVSMGNPIDFGYVMKSILDPIFFMSGFVIATKHEIKDDRLHITLGRPCLSMPYSVLSMVEGSNIRTTSLTLTKEATHLLSVNGFLSSSETLLSHVVEMFSQDSETVKKDFMQQMVCGLVYGLASREDSEIYIVNGDNIHGRVYIEDKSLADVIQWALTLNGISCHCVYGIHKKKYVLYVKTLKDNAIGMSYHSVKKQNVADKNLVYSCFTVPSGLLVTRYHGRITVNGNTAIKLFGEENYSKDARKKAKCVAGDTILHTAEGHTIAIRDLVSDETRKNAVIGEPVELPEPKTRISTPEGWSHVTHWISNGKKDTLKLIIERQLTLEVTPDHLVGKYDPDASDDLLKKYRLARADSLSVGDRVLWDYCPMRITDIQKGSSDVYDITVDNASHTFHANGVVVHNCASFGILYGSGAQGFNNSFPDMTLDECREFMTKFKAALPNITSGQQAYVEHAKIYGCVPTAFGRMRRVRWFLQSGDRAKVAFGERTVKNCYSPDTEFLTKDGWKLAKDILPDTQLAYYVPEKKVIRYTNAGERYTHRCTESVVYHSVSGAWNVTTNHRMWISKNGNDFESVVADKLCDMDKFTVITSSFMDDENAKHKHDETAFTIDGKSFTFEDMAFLLGVCIRRGVITYENGGGSRDGVLTVTCDASQIPVRDRLKNTFGDLITDTKRLQAGKYLKLIRFGVSLRDYVKENIGKTRKAFHVPSWIYDADTLTVEAFIAGVVGQKMIEHPNDRFTFRTHNQKLADDIQRLCTMCGFFTRLMANKDANGKNAFTMHIQRMNLMIIGNRKRDEYRQRPVHKVTHEEMEYSCFEVPSHILVTRYRGFVSYHMNTTVQGTAADVLKLIFCRLWKKVFKPYPQVKFMSTIHDEVNFSIPIELAREVIPICMECMTINRSDWPVTLKCSLSVSRTDLGSLVPFTYDFEHDTYEPEWDTLDVKPKKKEEPKLVVAVPDETNQDEAEMELHFEFLTDEDMLF